MLNESERLERMNQLGASDMHKLFNFNNKGAQDLWAEKLGLIERPEFSNLSINAGNLLEEDCLRFYFENKGVVDYELNPRVEHKDIPNFVVSLDARYNGIPVEHKTINMEKFLSLKQPEKNHIIQVNTQMAACDSEQGIIVYSAVNDDDLKDPLNYKPSVIKQESFLIELNPELKEEIERRAKYFLWCVKYKRKPNEQHYRSTLF